MKSVIAFSLLCSSAFGVVVPGPSSPPSCYQNGVSGYVTQVQFNHDGTTAIEICDGQQTSNTDPQHCISTVVPPNFNGATLVNNPCTPSQPGQLILPGTLKMVNGKRQQECGL